jgi:hypothetical protein
MGWELCDEEGIRVVKPYYYVHLELKHLEI